MLLLASSVCGLFKWRQFEPEMILLAVGGTCVFHCRTVTSRNSLLSVDFWSTTSPSGGGYSVTPRNLSADCDHSFDRPTTVGGWTKPTSELRASGCIYTGLSTPAVRRSTSFSRLNATQRRLSAFSPRPWAVRTTRASGHQHRRARRLSTSHRAAQSRGCSEGELPSSTGTVPQ